jgi:hypothetical protein
MRKIFTLSVLLICHLLTAQHKFNTRLIPQKSKTEGRKKIPNTVFNINPVATDTLDEYVIGDNGGLGTMSFDYVAPYDTGFAIGSNIFGLTSSLQRFDITKSGTINDILMGFGYATGSGTFTVCVRADSSGMPGHTIESFPVPVSQIDMIYYNYFGDSISYLGWNCKTTLPTPLTFTAGTSIWVGFTTDSLNSYAIGMMSTSGPAYPAPANYMYQMYKDSLITSNYALGFDAVLSIFPVVEYPVAQIKGNVFNDLNGNNHYCSTVTKTNSIG